MPLLPECVVRTDPGGGSVVIDRGTGGVFARGTAAQVFRAVQGIYAVTDAPLLGPVREETDGLGTAAYPEFVQRVAESVVFNGRRFVRDLDPWTDGILYPDHLGIAFTERLADVPAFVRGVEGMTGRVVDSVRGTASVAGFGDPPLLGDWLRSGAFQPARLVARFVAVLGGSWAVAATPKTPGFPDNGYWVTITRVPGA